MDYSELSEKQRRVYAYIVSRVREQGYAPSVREIGAAMGLRSPSTVHFHLKKLAAAGMIAISPGKGRAISLTASSLTESSLAAPSLTASGFPDAPALSRTPDRDRVPVVGDVAAGSPIPALENVEEYLTFDTGGRPEEYFALRVRGESMLNAGILPGDLVVVRRQPEAENGEIVVALLGDEATVKRFSRRNGRLWLLPENEHYRPIDGSRARILGKVTAVVRRY